MQDTAEQFLQVGCELPTDQNRIAIDPDLFFDRDRDRDYNFKIGIRFENVNR
jgi:hypothetical protein